MRVQTLWHALKPGGIYIVEDTSENYIEKEFLAPDTFMAFMKQVATRGACLAVCGVVPRPTLYAAGAFAARLNENKRSIMFAMQDCLAHPCSACACSQARCSPFWLESQCAAWPATAITLSATAQACTRAGDGRGAVPHEARLHGAQLRRAQGVQGVLRQDRHGHRQR